MKEGEKRWRKENPEKVKEQRKRWREKKKERQRQAENERRENRKAKAPAWQRKYRERHREACNERSVPEKSPPTDPPCVCGACLSCGGWSVSWKPEWRARLNAWLGSLTKGPSSEEDWPAIELEDLPAVESEVETLSTVSTSEV